MDNEHRINDERIISAANNKVFVSLTGKDMKIQLNKLSTTESKMQLRK